MRLTGLARRLHELNLPDKTVAEALKAVQPAPVKQVPAGITITSIPGQACNVLLEIHKVLPLPVAAHIASMVSELGEQLATSPDFNQPLQ